MKVPFFDLSAEISNRKAEILAEISAVIDSGQFVGGPLVEKFEMEFALLNESSFCAGVGNGLDAIRLVLEALEIGPGDEVIVPSFTFYATWLAVMQVGATPIFADVLEGAAGLNPELIEEAISLRTSAIIVFHLYGTPSRVSAINRIADKFSLPVIEACAQSHCARIEGKKVGTFGLAGAVSFYPTKNLGAIGDAGAASTDYEQVLHFLKSRRSYGQGNSKYEHIDIGWNSRLDPIQAAVTSFKLRHLAGFNSRRKDIASSYLEAMGDRSQKVIGLGQENSVWNHFVIRSDNRESLMHYLAEQGVGTDIHYPYYNRDSPALNKYLHISPGQQLDSPTKGLYVRPGLWRNLQTFSKDAVCLVLASEHFDEADYLHEYSDYLLWAGAN